MPRSVRDQPLDVLGLLAEGDGGEEDGVGDDRLPGGADLTLKELLGGAIIWEKFGRLVPTSHQCGNQLANRGAYALLFAHYFAPNPAP